MNAKVAVSANPAVQPWAPILRLMAQRVYDGTNSDLATRCSHHFGPMDSFVVASSLPRLVLAAWVDLLDGY